MRKLLAILCAFGLFVAVGVSVPGCGKGKTTTPAATTTPSPTTSPSTTTK